MSTLGGERVLEVHLLQVPHDGGWYLDVSLDSTTLPDVGASTMFTVGDLSLVGTVTSAAFDDHAGAGARPRVMVEGGAGWSKKLARQGGYASAGGTRLSTVLRDLADLAKEPYDAPAVDAVLPAGYGWPASTPAEPITGRHVLADLVKRGAIPTWRVAPTGRTRFDAWSASGAADDSGRVTDRNLARGRRTVGLDTRVTAFLPGGTLEGVTISRLRLTETGSQLTALVYLDAPGPLDLLRETVMALFPWIAGIRLGSQGGLRVLAAASRLLHLQGDAGDPAVLRVPDVARLVFDPGVPGATPPALYLTRDGGQTFVPVAIVAGGSTVGGTIPPPPATPTTALAPTGSARVTCG